VSPVGLSPGGAAGKRILVMSDMEGVSGIVVWEQVMGGKPMYEEGRRLYTEEINAAVRGARAGGATEVVVVDCHGAGEHWSFNSLVPDLLDDGCEWVAHHGWSRYTELLEQGCDGVLLIGMHARAGTPDGVLCHTVSSTRWRSLRVNGVVIGETGINAALCGHWGAPALLVTGDEATCREARDLLGADLPAVAVKRGLGRFSARQLPPRRARALIEEAARRAVAEPPRVPAYVPARPTELVVELHAVEDAEKLRERPGIELRDPLTAVSRGADWLAAWRQVYPA
jgi:D-amino peptidase